ncbi:MAG: glycosyltransferase family 39 protein [Vicinamibacterales bacterium]|mgnify:CR=1 FL=1|jgi:hypothetical protein|nr:hypothetical protein [Acidobacteriota bacterium]MDP6373167.1 glycosyltransferase family 39 protein [Vicinamibacterales bacterium]|tara:strand:+ start:3901 stop:5424 length:1524 start_codon:yes stop_codon:yes gene_type:complete
MTTTRAAGIVFGIVGCVYLTTTGGSFATDLASYEVTKNLVQRGSFAMSYNVLATEAERGVDGRYYAPVGLAHPVFGIPFYVASRLIQRVSGVHIGKPETLDKAAVVVGSAVAAALCAPLAFLFAWRLTGSMTGSLTAAFGLAFGTTLWPYSKFGFNAPLATCGLLAATLCSWIGVREERPAVLVVGGAFLGAALLTRHEMGVMAIPIGGWIVALSWPSRARILRRCALFGAPIAVAVGMWMWYNAARFGHPFDTGLLRDPNVRFDAPLWVGLHGLLASPGRSLFLYAPITAVGALALRRLATHDRSTALLFAGQAVTLVLLIARMHQWDGGESYGPRYLVPVLPYLTMPVAALFPLQPGAAWRWILPGTLALSVLVQLPGVLVDYSKIQNAFARRTDGYSIQMSRYTWQAAPLVLNSKSTLEGVPRNVGYLTGMATPPDVVEIGQATQRDFSQQFSFSLDFWWLYLFYLGAVPAGIALALGLAPLAIASWLCRSLLVSLHRPEALRA